MKTNDALIREALNVRWDHTTASVCLGGQDSRSGWTGLCAPDRAVGAAYHCRGVSLDGLSRVSSNSNYSQSLLNRKTELKLKIEHTNCLHKPSTSCVFMILLRFGGIRFGVCETLLLLLFCSFSMTSCRFTDRTLAGGDEGLVPIQTFQTRRKTDP